MWKNAKNALISLQWEAFFMGHPVLLNYFFITSFFIYIKSSENSLNYFILYIHLENISKSKYSKRHILKHFKTRFKIFLNIKIFIGDVCGSRRKLNGESDGDLRKSIKAVLLIGKPPGNLWTLMASSTSRETSTPSSRKGARARLGTSRRVI